MNRPAAPSDSETRSPAHWGRRLEILFWIAFVVVPLLTGILAYRWLPNESFDERKHELLLGDQVGDRWQEHGVRARMWKSKKTGEVFTPASFDEHRAAEAIRLPVTWFTYGLLGCVVYAWRSSRSQGQGGTFFHRFGTAVALNLVAAVFAYFMAAR